MRTPSLHWIVLLTLTAAWNTSLSQTDRSSKAARASYIKPDGLLLIDTHYGTFANLTPEMESDLGFPGFNIYAFRNHRLNGSNTLFFAWGLGFSAYNHFINGQFSEPFEDSDHQENTGVFFAPYPDSYDYTRNRVTAHYIEIPLELRFRSKHRTPFRFSVGGTVGYAINSFTTTLDNDGKRRIYDVAGLNSLRYGLTGRMGVGRVSIYGFYGLSNFLSPSASNQMLTPVTIGINLLLI